MLRNTVINKRPAEDEIKPTYSAELGVLTSTHRGMRLFKSAIGPSGGVGATLILSEAQRIYTEESSKHPRDMKLLVTMPEFAFTKLKEAYDTLHDILGRESLLSEPTFPYIVITCTHKLASCLCMSLHALSFTQDLQRLKLPPEDRAKISDIRQGFMGLLPDVSKLVFQAITALNGTSDRELAFSIAHALQDDVQKYDEHTEERKMLNKFMADLYVRVESQEAAPIEPAFAAAP